MISRRKIVGWDLWAAAMPVWSQTGAAGDAGQSRVTAYAFFFRNLREGDIRLADSAGRPMLIVNTASLCGYTPQDAALQQLYLRYRDRGLVVIGVPSNDFGGQEPGGDAEIVHTAHGQFGVTFPMAGKTTVKGPSAHGFYRWVAAERPLDTPRWNFHKYLVGKDGRLAGSYGSQVEPLDLRLIAAIERELPAAG